MNTIELVTFDTFKKISNQAAFKGMKMAVIFMNNLDLIREVIKRAT